MRLGLPGAACLCIAGGAWAQDAVPPLTCFGAEPSWSLEIGDDGATFRADGPAEILYAITDMRAAVGRTWPKAVTLFAPEDTAIAILRPQPCSDTMSDRDYAWTVDFLTQRAGEAVILTGCCRASED